MLAGSLAIISHHFDESYNTGLHFKSRILEAASQPGLKPGENCCNVLWTGHLTLVQCGSREHGLPVLESCLHLSLVMRPRHAP